VRSIALILMLAGCGGSSTMCTEDAKCPKMGTYKFCGNQYRASDGSTFDCVSSTDCIKAMMDAAAWCAAH
jgi:hypothetical protein